MAGRLCRAGRRLARRRSARLFRGTWSVIPARAPSSCPWSSCTLTGRPRSRSSHHRGTRDDGGRVGRTADDHRRPGEAFHPRHETNSSGRPRMVEQRERADRPEPGRVRLTLPTAADESMRCNGPSEKFARHFMSSAVTRCEELVGRRCSGPSGAAGSPRPRKAVGRPTTTQVPLPSSPFGRPTIGADFGVWLTDAPASGRARLRAGGRP
jgi:hypothetical protein